MHRLTLLLFLLLAAIGVAAAQTASPSESPTHWQSYVIKGEELSFELPQGPTAIAIFRPVKEPRDPSKKPKTGRMYGAYGNGVVYLILSFDNPAGAEGLDTFLKEIDDYPINGRPQTLERDLLLGGFHGKQYSFGSPVLSGVVRFYKSKSHVYIVEATSEDMSRPDIKKFLDSLSLASKKVNYDPDRDPLETQTTSAALSDMGAGANSDAPAIFNAKTVSRKARVVAKPEPGYTEEARRNQVTGTVVLKAVFASSGRVERIVVLRPLPHGLTEKAKMAARNIRFIPALKDGKYVSMYIQLEYSFNLY